MVGFLDGLLGGGAQQGPNPEVMKLSQAYGLPPEVIEQAQSNQQINTLGQIGATLLAAAQPGPIGQRGQILAQLGNQNFGGDMNRQLLNSAQMRLYAENLRDRQSERGAKEAFMKGLNDGTLGVDERTATALKQLGPKAFEVYQTVIASQLKPAEWSQPQPGPDGKLYQRNMVTGKMEAVGGGGVSIVNQGESEEAKTLGKAKGDAIVDLTKIGTGAISQISKLNLLENILGSIQTGKFAEQKGNIVAGMRSLGMSDEKIKELSGLDPNLPAAQQAALKLINEMTVGLIGQGQFPANNFSDADRMFLSKINPNIDNEPEANKVAIEVQRRIAQRNYETYQMWNVYKRSMREQGKTADYDDFREQYSQMLIEKEKRGEGLFKDLEERALQTRLIRGAPQGGGPATPPGSITPGDYSHLWRTNK